MKNEMHIFREQIFGDHQAMTVKVTEIPAEIPHRGRFELEITCNNKCLPMAIVENKTAHSQKLHLVILGSIEADSFKKAMQLWLDTFPVNPKAKDSEELSVEFKQS